MSFLLWLVFLRIICAKRHSNVTGVSSTMYSKNRHNLDCKKGIWLSTSVCVPKGYLKGEAPVPNTIINTKVEINNIRDVDDKKMRITLDYYQDLIWVDDRIKTRFLSSEKPRSVLNNHLIDTIWKPDLWIHNLYDFELHSVLEPTGGLVIMEQSCQSDSCPNGKNNSSTLVRYNLEARATIYCNFHFFTLVFNSLVLDFSEYFESLAMALRTM